MKKIFLRYTRKQLALLAGGLCSLTACVDEGLNIDAYRITDEQLMADANEGGYLLPVMMNNIVPTSTALQTVQNLQAESYAGYMESPTPFLNNVNTMTYFMVSGWNHNSWYTSTNNVMNNWLLMRRNEVDIKYPDLYAIATIIKVAAAQRLVDTFGPYPYSGYGEGSEVAFDSEEEAYNAFFSDLDEAVAALQAAEAADPNADAVRFVKWDRSSLGGEYTNWIKAANSLRLRMAMRISGVAPVLAQQEAEKAVATVNGGILDRAFEINLTATNPYYTFANAWSDTRLSASIETYLKGFEDPRLDAYALPVTDNLLDSGDVKGIRPGVAKPDKDRYIGYSLPNIVEADPIKVIDVAEGYFLKAEGVLRGWNMGGGTAQQFYEDGIRASFTYNGVSGVDEYLLSTGTQVAYVDPKNPANDSENDYLLSTVTVPWAEELSFDEKLEKIITQKWIAIYPEGTEAWSEFRRTGYPKMYPIKVTNNSDLPLGTFIKRLTYPLTVISASGQAVANAVAQHLGGNDSAATPLWWDVD